MVIFHLRKNGIISAFSMVSGVLKGFLSSHAETLYDLETTIPFKVRGHGGPEIIGIMICVQQSVSLDKTVVL